MLADQFHLKDDLCASDLCVEAVRTMPACFTDSHQVTLPSLVSTTGDGNVGNNHQHLISQANYQSGHAIRYYQPLMEHYPLNRYSSLNQKRESVITFSSNAHASLKSSYLEALDLDDDKTRSLLGNNVSSGHKLNNNKYKCGNQVMIDGFPFTVDQVVCICQVLQKSDVHKLEKFIYNLPADNKLTKNELILRARAIASYHSGNYKEVYDLLENNNFSVKYHQELQNLWNNAHYKEHELKRGHPPGAVEKYRIRKKFQFPRTIWDGEEYVYCFKEKNRRILKEFYQKCNLPTQEDKLKLSSQTQLTVVQISNWFKNRRQRDRQPNHEHD
ncbi:Sequence-specific DNA binding, partial [Blomia tropicalis]